MEIGVESWLVVNDQMIFEVHDTLLMAESNAAIYLYMIFQLICAQRTWFNALGLLLCRTVAKAAQCRHFGG